MKPIIAALLLSALAATTCLAQNLNKGGPAERNFYQELPYEQINGKIIIDVEIGGVKHKFLMDTGAPDQISDALAAELGIAATRQAGVNDAFGNTGTAKIATVESIKLGGVDFKDVPAIIGGIPAFVNCFGIDGIIGSNLLRNTIVTFNSAKKVIIITDDADRLNLNEKNKVALNTKKDKQSSPIFILNIDAKVTGEFEFDSGDSGLLELSNGYMDIFKEHQADFEVLDKGYGANSFSGNGAENNNIKYRLKFPALKIGNVTLKNVKTETVLNNSGTGSRIGSKLLDYGVLTLDYLHGNLYFDPFTAETDLSEKSWPLSPTYSDGKLVIGVVWGKMKDAVKPGMQITAVNGVSFEQVDFCKLFTQKSILQGQEKATLTIKDEKGNLIQLEIVKE